ncbi:LOW QUALITY PROTEIN: uncharacterized protein [Patagioenas fasciata]|uniref:LOW QUALITY PROTEIN: uncharacterized protein n=1 Tax=Patagioenas fasciata TaxID=372321 RepID=UPI003A998472
MPTLPGCSGGLGSSSHWQAAERVFRPQKTTFLQPLCFTFQLPCAPGSLPPAPPRVPILGTDRRALAGGAALGGARAARLSAERGRRGSRRSAGGAALGGARAARLSAERGRRGSRRSAGGAALGGARAARLSAERGRRGSRRSAGGAALGGARAARLSAERGRRGSRRSAGGAALGGARAARLSAERGRRGSRRSAGGAALGGARAARLSAERGRRPELCVKRRLLAPGRGGGSGAAAAGPPGPGKGPVGATLCNKLMKSAACQQHPHLLKMKRSFHVQAEQQNKLCGPDTTQPYALTLGNMAGARSIGFLADILGSRLQHGTPIYVPAHLYKAESTWRFGKSRGQSSPMSLDKLFLAVSTLQNVCKAAPVRSHVHHHTKVKEAWESEQHHPERYHIRGNDKQIHKPSRQRKNDQAAQLQHAKLRRDSLTPRRISVPFETKMLQLKLKNSLHGPTVKSSIPAPSAVRLKTCPGLLEEKKAPGEVIPPPGDGVQVVDPITAAAERTKPTHATSAQMEIEAASRRKISFCTNAADPSQPNGGFRLLTEKQKERCEAAVAAQCKAEQQLTEEQERACRKAGKWLRKAKGLPVDSFTGEGKIPAPELGFDAFI